MTVQGQSAMTEEWRPIPGFPGYEVSNRGRVLSCRRGTAYEMRGWTTEYGYRMVQLSRDGRPHGRYVHGLVAAAFIGPRPEGLEVRHTDGDNRNNDAANLTYGSSGANKLDQVRHGTHPHARKTHCPQNHPYDEENTLRSHGKRKCRACNRAYDARRARRG